jgi:hypothetical protein
MRATFFGRFSFGYEQQSEETTFISGEILHLYASHIRKERGAKKSGTWEVERNRGTALHLARGAARKTRSFFI